MKSPLSTIRIFVIAALIQGTTCFADVTFSDMPQATPPQIDDQTKQLILSRIQANPVLPAASPTAAPTATALPKNLPALLYKAGASPANNLDNQGAYQDKLKQYLLMHNNRATVIAPLSSQ